MSTAEAIQRALGAATAIRHRADGKPEAGEVTVSAADGAELTLAVARREGALLEDQGVPAARLRVRRVDLERPLKLALRRLESPLP